MNTHTHLTSNRLKRAKQTRFNPLTSISDPAQIARKLDAFEVGYIKEVVNIWDTLEQRDDLIRAVVSKRKKAAGRQGWTVLIRDSVPPARRAEAEEHAAALEYFYENLRCENALDRAERGGFKLLARQMMDAVGKRFAVHEIVWEINTEATENTEDTERTSLQSKQGTRKEHRPFAPRRGEGQDEGFPGDTTQATANTERVELPATVGPVPPPGSNPVRRSRSDETLEKEAHPRPSEQSAVSDSVLSAPSALNRPLLSATFRFVPLSFFENTTGQLRYLESDSAVEGTPLNPGAWMVTVGEGLMMATASAWILKNMTLNDWLLYSERNGRPGLRATTSAAPDSDEWNALETALTDILSGSAVVHSSTDDIKVIDLAAGGNIPFPDLVDRIDRMIAALWRGADLSTLSRDRGYGASLQEKESATLEQDDAEMLTETLNEYVDAWVIRYLFGEGVKPLANVKVLVTPRESTPADIQIDEFLIRNGALLSTQETMSRYGRAAAKPGERALAPLGMIHTENTKNTENTESPTTVGPVPPPGANPVRSSRSNETLDKQINPRPSEKSTVNHALQLSSAPSALNYTENTKSTEEGETTANKKKEENGDFSALSVSSAPSVLMSSFPNDFTLLQRDWVQLSPYGDFSHSRGLQRVNRAAAEIMVAQFNSFRGRLGRLFGGAPFYVGHPDMPSSSDLADRKAYGWIMQLEARDDGLYGLVKWSDAGLDLLKNAHFKYLSPFWEAKEIGSENGRRVFQPVAIISVGLTNQPNIPVRPLANEQGENDTENTESTEKNDGIQLQPAVGPVPPPGGGLKINTEETERTEEESKFVDCLKTPGEGTGPTLTGSAISVPSAISVFNPPRSHRVTLANLHTRSITENIGQRRGERIRFENAERRRDRIHEAVHAKMREGLTYHQAWTAVKRQHTEWFRQEN